MEDSGVDFGDGRQPPGGAVAVRPRGGPWRMKGEARRCERSEHRERSERAEGFGGRCGGGTVAVLCGLRYGCGNRQQLYRERAAIGGE